MPKKLKNCDVKITPSVKKKTLRAFFDYYELSNLLFDNKRDEIYNVTDIPEDNKFYSQMQLKAQQMKIDWSNMTHADSNRVMLAVLEDLFNAMRDIENSKSIILHLKIEVNECS